MIVDKFFRSDYEKWKPYFDEGPPQKPKKIIPINSGSIDTTQIDAWRQGAEITDIKHFDAGVVKIHAGEPGHVLPQKSFGYGSSFRSQENSWKEIDLFNPVDFILAQNNYTTSSITLTWPIVIKDYDATNNYEIDGIIEPITIRAVASFFSINIPWEPHAVRGSVLDGNLNFRNATDRIMSVDYFNPNSDYIEYFDMVDMFGNMPLNGYFRDDQISIKPFVDQRLPRDIPLSNNYSKQLSDALSKVYLSGSESITYKSTDTYIGYNQISAATGFTFDSVQGIGTDSIAFGGLIY